MRFSFPKVVKVNGSTYSGKKLGGTDNELFLLALQHHCSFSGGQGRPALKNIWFALESHLLPGLESLEPQVILLWFDLFHGSFV
jgi:hypothetical protein